jgi:dUTP pyrophosphatase
MITFEPLHTDVEAPTRATALSAGYDLKAYLLGRKVTVYEQSNMKREVSCTKTNPVLLLLPGDRAVVPLGFKATLPAHLQAEIRPRSGQSLKVGLCVLNSPGTIDADYPGEWAVLVENRSSTFLSIDHGERIAQAVLMRYEVEPWVAGVVGVSTERIGGYGSTGA